MQKRGVAAQQAILDAALELFLETGYKSASMEAIARRAGVSKATLYGHFCGKEGLFHAVIEGFSSRILRLFPEARACQDVRQELTDFAERFSNAMISSEKVAWDRMIVAAVHQFPHLAKDYFAIGPQRGIQQVREFLRVQHEAGLLQVPDPVFSAEMLIGMLMGTKLYQGLLFGKPVARESLRLSETVDAFLKVHSR